MMTFCNYYVFITFALVFILAVAIRPASYVGYPFGSILCKLSVRHSIFIKLNLKNPDPGIEPGLLALHCPQTCV